jgi:hypothetical protein
MLRRTIGLQSNLAIEVGDAFGNSRLAEMLLATQMQNACGHCADALLRRLVNRVRLYQRFQLLQSTVKITLTIPLLGRSQRGSRVCREDASDKAHQQENWQDFHREHELLPGTLRPGVETARQVMWPGHGFAYFDWSRFPSQFDALGQSYRKIGPYVAGSTERRVTIAIVPGRE